MSLLRVRQPGQPSRDIDLGPSPVVHRAPGYQVRPANMLADAIPTVKARSTHEERARHPVNPVILRELAGDPRPVRERCGAMMAVLKEPCARFAGHATEHRSRYQLDNNAVHRRTNRPLGGIQ